MILIQQKEDNMIILIGGEKGGTGKTTLSTNIAARLAATGSDVLLVDTDKQGSASSWSALRESDTSSKLPKVPCIQKFGSNLSATLNDLNARYDDIVIDAGGRDSVELRASLAVADRIYIPLQASQFDVWTLGAMDKLVEQATALNPKLKAYVIINRASPNPAVSEVKEAKNLFEDIEHLHLMDIVLKDRIAYRKAAKTGQAVFELDQQDPKSIEEIENLFKEIFYEDKHEAA